MPVELRVAYVGRRMAARALAAVQDVGISEGAWWVLHELVGAPGGLPLVELARRTAFSASAVTAVTDQLAARGWISRERATGDRRQVVAALTKAGRTALDAGLARAEQAFTAERGRLSPVQWQQLELLLTRLVPGLAEETAPAHRQAAR